MTTVSGGTLVVSIDLPPTEGPSSLRSVSMISDQLAKLVEQMRMPVTWGFDHPAKAPLALRLATSSLGHEIAVLGDATWASRDAGRTRFVRQLTGRVEAARNVGIPVSTLSLVGTSLKHNLDVLVKQRISVVRAASGSIDPGFVRAHALRFGVWEARPTVSLPTSNRWWPASQLRVRWTLGKAIQNHAIAHLSIDGRILGNDGTDMKRIERVLRYAVRLRDEGLLSVRTLSHLSRRFQRIRRTAPMRSILRKVA